MGLSGRKAKQRIGKDPRNLSWADDASRFGQTYLAKFGWDASKGLGTSGEGRTTAIKATQKLDMLGVGMQHQKDPNGIAWRQQQDFENLLRRLNDGTDPPGPFCKARAEEEGESLLEGGEEKSASDAQEVDDDEGEGIIKKKEKKKKKRKNAEEPDEVTHDKKRRKKRKRSKEEDGDGHAVPNTESEPIPLPSPAEAAPMTVVIAPTPVPIRAPPRTHRARMIAAKRMALSNSTALAEILGIPSSSTSSFSSPHMSNAVTPTPTPAPGPAAEAQEPLQQLTTSSQSVGDYFKAKLSAKRQSHPTLATADLRASAPTSSRDDGDDHNRAGLGSGGGASRVPLMDSLDEGRMRGGIGASSSKFAAMFTLAQPMTDAQEKNATPAVELVETQDAADLDDDRRKGDKKQLAKEERRRKKEQKRRRRAEAGQVDDDTAKDMPIDETPVGQAKKKKRHERGSEDTQTPNAVGVEVIQEKRREKHKKSAKHRRPEE